jgi:Glycosyl transferase family 2
MPSSTSRPPHRQISAMMRVRNEAEFLEAAVRSIADDVDEILLVDNGSTDDTPAIIRELRRELGNRVRFDEYPYEIRRVGADNWELAADPEAADSPHLSANFYNWCLDRCTKPYALKWDGDMLALPAFRAALDDWVRDDAEVLIIQGLNVHPDEKHLIRPRSTDREQLMKGLKVPGMPRWVTWLTQDYPEPRLFPRAGVRYSVELLWTQTMESPELKGKPKLRADDPCYLHLKFCKHDPWSNYSDDLARVIASNVGVGEALSAEWLEIVQRSRRHAPVPGDS